MADDQNATPATSQNEELSDSQKHERDSDQPFHQQSENAQAVDGGVTSDPQINPTNTETNTEASPVVPTNDSVDENDSAEPKSADVKHEASVDDVEKQ